MMVNVMDFFKKNIGNYPYKQYSFIQGGDGGMEYAMSTLMLGNGTLEGIYGTATHELGILGSNTFWLPMNQNTLGWMRIYNLCFRFSRK
jgi:hypothetical protein